MKAPCKRCGEMFERNTRHHKICNDCNRKSFLESLEKRRQKRENAIILR